MSTKPIVADTPEEARTAKAARAPDLATYPKAIAIIATIAALYFGRNIFIPLAIAVLLTFALAPGVALLRKLRVPRAIAVVVVVLGAFASLIAFGVVVGAQLGSLAQNLPAYQTNIEAKVALVKDADIGQGLFERVSRLFSRLGEEIKQEEETTAPGAEAGPAEAEVRPMPVEVIEPAAEPLEVLQTVVGPLVEPLATGGIILVVVIFMLLRREDLRDRFIRLVGAGDLHRTTEALQEAGAKVGLYLLMQLVVNLTYAVPVGIGLWIIGVPNAPLWALLALVLRFIPYIGPVIAAVFPLALALAVDPGWTMVLWTAALFVALELASNNIVEPWLYGSRTGLSPLAIIIAAIFWTWLWGTLGLLLSTPLTVCLVVLGRHVPQFAFLEVLFGTDPVLEPHQQLYQRLLSGDPVEATERAEAFLDDNTIAAFYETVALPALALGERDRARGVMTEDRLGRVVDSATILVSNLEDYVSEAAQKADKEGALDEPAAKTSRARIAADTKGMAVVCCGGRGELDDVAASMLAHVLAGEGIGVTTAEHSSLQPGRLRRMPLESSDALIIVFLNTESLQHARYAVRRVKRLHGSLYVGIVLWDAPATLDLAKVSSQIGCEVVARSFDEASNHLRDTRGPSKRAAAKVPRAVKSPAPIVAAAS